jgi:hypothetical protein
VTCPSCRRPVAIARPTCLYCGAELPAEATAQAEAAAEAAARAVATPAGPLGRGFVPPAAPVTRDRSLLVVDLTGAPPSLLTDLLGLTAFEARLRARAGGLHLHRVGPPQEVRAEATILAEAGLLALALPEAEVRAAPLVATGGEPHGRRLRLRTSTGPPTDVAAEDLLLIVEGPIQREYQPRKIERHKVRTATLDPGYRFHLHRRSDLRPVELDPASFAFGPRGPVAGSSLLELKAWMAGLGPDVPSDDGFRREPVALAPAPPDEGAAASLGRTAFGPGRRKDARTILDNLAQFRFYSGWRAAAFRRR